MEQKIMNISSVRDCYGCGVCAIACPKRIIDIRLNKEGFYEPYINDKAACINCSICLSVCSYSDNTPIDSVAIKSYAGWSKNREVLQKCSSGGIASELGRLLLTQGYKVCAVRYNVEKERAEHYIAKDTEELLQSAGSKYIQSYTFDGFSLIDSRDKYLIIGTPCQIDSFRKYIKRKKIEENFVLMDFFCHGVPSMLLWKKYLSIVKNRCKRIENIVWRNKRNGWHDSYVISANTNTLKEYFSPLSTGDLFFKFFLGNMCLGKACYAKCKYKATNSSADIRIGDFWGNKYKSNNDSVNGILTFTSKGEKCITDLNASCWLKEEPLSVVLEGQMKKSVSRPFIYTLVLKALQGKMQLSTISLYYLRPYKVLLLPKRIKNKIYRMIRR